MSCPYHKGAGHMRIPGVGRGGYSHMTLFTSNDFLYKAEQGEGFYEKNELEAEIGDAVSGRHNCCAVGIWVHSLFYGGGHSTDRS